VTKTAAEVIRVAVAGNPNSGKTTIFNNITGAHQKVGNYPGVTVERKEGTVQYGGLSLSLVDLPGTYSLTAYSEEEIVTREFLLNEKPDVVVNVLDASSLERNLFFTTELLEIGCPLILVLNMADVAESRGQRIDTEQLSELLGVPVVTAVGNRNEGMESILAAVTQVVESGGLHDPGAMKRVNYGPEIESQIDEVSAHLPQNTHQRWLALKILEGDTKVLGTLPMATQKAVSGYGLSSDADDADTQLALLRYAFIGQICDLVYEKPAQSGGTVSDKIDRVAMHPFWGIPIFLGLMFLVFTLTFTVGNPLMDLIDQGIGIFSQGLTNAWPDGAAVHLRSLIIDGIIGGVGGVLVFLPNIVLLFMAIAILEGTGYMARAAFVMDRFMSRVGLHGKSFIPLLIGFGCTIPAIMATRTLESRRDRLITMMVLPLMSCGARLPIYALLIPAFFAPKWQGPALWLIYVLGIVLALGGALLLRSTMFRGETTPFLMELPPYHMPTLGSLLVQMWTRAQMYLKKAGTVILGASILLWFLTYFPKPPADYIAPADFDGPTSALAVPFDQITDADERQAAELSYSIAGRVGHALVPIIKPMGFDWRIGTALVGATAAKEVFVAQMGIVFAVGEADETNEDLRQRLRGRYSSLVGLCIMIFALISTPCIATFAITRQEAGSVRWALAQVFGLTGFAWVLTVAVYQGGLLLGFGGVQ
jgi:ferrous iron transport protein B